MNNNSSSEVFLEHLYENKVFKGAEPVFIKESLVVKKNESGITGVFAAREFEPDEMIIMIENNSGINYAYALEEAGEMLSVLGTDKYYLDQKAVLALALYKRYMSNAEGDAFFSGIKIEEVYKNTPMAMLQKEFVEFLSPNSKSGIWNASFLEKSIRKLNIEFEIFCFCYAFVSSRSWETVGLLPCLDRFNSSDRGNSNAYFKKYEHKCAYFADRKIQKGEEITWNYNQVDAVSTFIGYGYLDSERLYRAEVDYWMDNDEITEFVNTWSKRCDALHSTFRRSELDFFDVNKYTNFLSLPGIKSSGSKKSHQIENSIQSYKILLTIARMRLISKKRLKIDTYSPNDSNIVNLSVYGLDFDLECIQLVADTIRNSKNLFSQRVKKYNDSPASSSCDITPINSIYHHVYDSWLKCLMFIEKLIFVKDAADACALIEKYLNVAIEPNDLENFVSGNRIESPDLTLELAREVLLEKDIICK